MADRIIRAQVTIHLDSLLPEDAVVNTFYFDQDDNGILPSPEETYNTAVDKLATFYQAIDGVIFPAVVWTEATVRIYDMRDPEPRQLRWQENFPLVPTASTALPNEMAICLSYSADVASGENARRRRGRVYLGPLAETVRAAENSSTYVSAAARTAIANAASVLATPTDVAGDPVSSLSWAIYSPTTDAEGANLDDSVHDIQTGWVDNAFDVQRRRGVKATTRTTWS